MTAKFIRTEQVNKSVLRVFYLNRQIFIKGFI